MGKLDAKTGGIRSPESAQRSPTQTTEERRYRAEENLRTMSKYHEIANDPDALKDVQALAQKQMTTLAKVANHASGATTRSGSSPDRRTNTNPPKAAGKGGSGSGGARNMGRASATSKTSK